MADLRSALATALPHLKARLAVAEAQLPRRVRSGAEIYHTHRETRFDHDWEIAHAINSNPSVDGHSRAPLADVRHLPRRDPTAEAVYRRQFKRRFAVA